MFSEILLWSNVIICPIVGCVLLFRRSYPTATIIFIVALSLISGLSYVDIRTLQNPEYIYVYRKYGLMLEVATIVCCYFYTKTIFRDNSEIYKGPGFWIAIVTSISLICYVVFSPIENLIFSPNFSEEHVLFLTKTGFSVYLVLLIFLVYGLVQLERTFAGLHQLQRWSVKLEVVGSGLLLAAFALYFSQNLLYRSINLTFLGIRSGAITVALVLFCYSRLFRSYNSTLALSRGIAHRSFVLLLVGGYLIVLGIVGEGLRYLNIADAQLLFFIILLVGSLVLAGVFLSEKLRRKLKVILHKNFYQSKYDYREQWEKFASKITTEAPLPEIQASILDLYCETLACKGAGFYLRDPDTNTYALTAKFNFRRDWRIFDSNDQLITKLRRRDWIINLREPNPDLDGSLVESFTDINAFLVIPLHFDEELEGFIVLGEQINTGEELTFEDYDLLRMLARQTIAIIQGMRLSHQLSATRELAAIGKVSTFVLHDLKNQVSGLSLLLENARSYLADPEFQQDMLDTVSNTVDNMKGLITRLKNLKEKPQLILETVDLKKIIDDAVGTVGGEIAATGENARIDADEEEIYKVVLNLLINAKEASVDRAPIHLEYGQEDGLVFIHVTDKGCGMSAQFIKDRLFKPFETTKKHGFGIGLYQCKQIIESHRGRIIVESSQGEGTKFSIFLPCALESR